MNQHLIIAGLIQYAKNVPHLINIVTWCSLAETACLLQIEKCLACRHRACFCLQVPYLPGKCNILQNASVPLMFSGVLQLLLWYWWITLEAGQTCMPLLNMRPWHGCTPTDLVFHFFLFAVGNALSFCNAPARSSRHRRPFLKKRSPVHSLYFW